MAEWRVRYDGTCSRCGIALRRGMPAVSDRATKTIHCIACPVPQPPPTPAPPQLPIVDSGVPGRSAHAEEPIATT
jgi:hypothetical protein